MTENDDERLKAEIDEIMTRVDKIMEKVSRIIPDEGPDTEAEEQ